MNYSSTIEEKKKMKHSVEAVIDKVSLKPNKIQPIIVSFQNGELKDEEALKMECGLYRDDKANKQLLALSNGHVVYKGYRPEPDEDLTYTMLAIHNKRTGKVRLVQAEKWQVAPILDKELQNDGGLDQNRIVELNKQFGSKRVKRRTEQMERMQFNVDSVKDQLEKAVSFVDINRSDLSLPSLNDESVANTNLPPCNRNASRIEDVYDVNDLVPQAKLKTLYQTCRTILEQGLEGKSRFFDTTLEALKSEPNNVEKIAVLLYIDAIACWLNKPIKEARRKMLDVCSFSTDIHNYIMQTFSIDSAQGRLRPSSMKDKGILHCLVLAFIVSNFTVDLNLFATTIKGRIGMKKLIEFSRLIGALPLKDNKTTVVLKLPLPPKLAVARKPGRKKK